MKTHDPLSNDHRLYIWTSTGMQEPEDLEKARSLGLRLYEVASPPTEGVVPRVPTYEMVQAGAKLVKDNLPYHTGTKAIYEAMIAAAPASSESAAVGALLHDAADCIREHVYGDTRRWNRNAVRELLHKIEAALKDAD